jgi:endonuclease/exonuclease/phosphatase family metal-dependent hydrolase
VSTFAVRRLRSATSVLSRTCLAVGTAALLASAMLVAGTSDRVTERSAEQVAGPVKLASATVRLAPRKKGFTFQVASFNVLGHFHTAKGGDRKGFASGPARMKMAYRILDKRGINVVGFQELQPPQLDKFNKLTGDSWGVYPGGRLENIAMHNSIAWKTHKWERVSASYINIPYFKGKPVKMPVVKLRHRKTGRLVYFANFHNPADTHGNAQKWRDKARRKQIALANSITSTRIPLVITGDMNERENYFCSMVGKTPMRAANGGSNHKHKPCKTPVPMGIDWIFGSPQIDFDGYQKVQSRRVRKATDHPFVFSRATIPAR